MTCCHLKGKDFILVYYLHSANEQQPPVDCSKVINIKYRRVLCNIMIMVILIGLVMKIDFDFSVII